MAEVVLCGTLWMVVSARRSAMSILAVTSPSRAWWTTGWNARSGRVMTPRRLTLCMCPVSRSRTASWTWPSPCHNFKRQRRRVPRRHPSPCPVGRTHSTVLTNIMPCCCLVLGQPNTFC